MALALSSLDLKKSAAFPSSPVDTGTFTVSSGDWILITPFAWGFDPLSIDSITLHGFSGTPVAITSSVGTAGLRSACKAWYVQATSGGTGCYISVSTTNQAAVNIQTSLITGSVDGTTPEITSARATFAGGGASTFPISMPDRAASGNMRVATFACNGGVSSISVTGFTQLVQDNNNQTFVVYYGLTDTDPTGTPNASPSDSSAGIGFEIAEAAANPDFPFGSIEDLEADPEIQDEAWAMREEAVDQFGSHVAEDEHQDDVEVTWPSVEGDTGQLPANEDSDDEPPPDEEIEPVLWALSEDAVAPADAVLNAPEQDELETLPDEPDQWFSVDGDTGALGPSWVEEVEPEPDPDAEPWYLYEDATAAPDAVLTTCSDDDDPQPAEEPDQWFSVEGEVTIVQPASTAEDEEQPADEEFTYCTQENDQQAGCDIQIDDESPVQDEQAEPWYLFEDVATDPIVVTLEEAEPEPEEPEVYWASPFDPIVQQDVLPNWIEDDEPVDDEAIIHFDAFNVVILPGGIPQQPDDFEEPENEDLLNAVYWYQYDPYAAPTDPVAISNGSLGAVTRSSFTVTMGRIGTRRRSH